MAKNKKSSIQAPPAASQQTAKYYTRYAEESGETTIEDSTDGYTLYRAISRQVIGSPSRFMDIRNAVLRFYLRVYANKLHPLHDECLQHEASTGANKPKYPLFAMLDCPDLETDKHDYVLRVVAYALKIRIHVFKEVSEDGEPQGEMRSIGPQDRPVCTVVKREITRRKRDKSGLIGMPYRFESLLPDESGKALIEYLQAQREEAAKDAATLQVKQISWAWIQTTGKESWTCFNEYRPESKEADLEYDDMRNRMDTFVVTVNESKHIRPALELFREALKRAPVQRRWIRHSHNKEAGFMLPHCSVDAEFVKMERKVAEEESPWERAAVRDGVLEELCSVLTFAIGRHFFLVFNVVHMLETSDKLTVPALTALFRETIFNKDLLKLWWNPQSDISVLDGTIAHMFQKTPREPYEHCPYGTDNEITIQPKWRIKRNHFQNARPDELKFPTEHVDCELHRMGGNELGITCCCRLANIDIAALFAHFCRMHDFGGDSDVKIRPWTQARFRFNYGDLLEKMLHTDRLYPLLSRMKDRAGRTGKSRDAFYQDMGNPGMEQEDDVMAYNIGDVAGQNMIFEMLLANDEKNFLAGCLSAFANDPFFGTDQRVIQRPSDFGSVAGIQLWDDNPRSFTDADFNLTPGFNCWPKAELYSTESLHPWEHDRRVHLMRMKADIVLQADESHSSRAYVLPTKAYRTATAHQKDILEKIHDPTKLAVSVHCVKKVDAVYEDPIVRAGTTHSEALLEFLKSSQFNKVSPPTGFGAAPGESDGLPAFLNRVPGNGLDQARNIFVEFLQSDEETAQQSDEETAQRLGKPQAIPETTDWQMKEPADLDLLFEEACQAQNNIDADGDKWKMADRARREAETARERELQKDSEEDLPYSLNKRDFFDLEGREYQRRAKQAQAWNRPELQSKLTVMEDGGVKSLAYMQLTAMRDKRRLPDVEGFEEVISKRRRLGSNWSGQTSDWPQWSE